MGNCFNGNSTTLLDVQYSSIIIIYSFKLFLEKIIAFVKYRVASKFDFTEYMTTSLWQIRIYQYSTNIYFNKKKYVTYVALIQCDSDYIFDHNDSLMWL